MDIHPLPGNLDALRRRLPSLRSANRAVDLQGRDGGHGERGRKGKGSRQRERESEREKANEDNPAGAKSGLLERAIRWYAQKEFFEVMPSALLGGTIAAALNLPAGGMENDGPLIVIVLIVTDLPIAVWLLSRRHCHRR